MENSAWMFISFIEGDGIEAREDRVLLGGGRQGQILQFANTISKLTFTTRLQTLIRRLVAVEAIPLTKYGQSILVSVDAHLIVDGERISLKQAKANGTFSIGSQKFFVNGGRSTDPSEIVISEKAGFLGTSLIPRGSVRFYATLEDSDIVGSLLEWLATPGKELQRRP